MLAAALNRDALGLGVRAQVVELGNWSLTLVTCDLNTERSICASVQALVVGLSRLGCLAR